MKKILIFAPTAPASGITQFVLNYINKLDLSQYTIDFVSFHNDRFKAWSKEHQSEYFELNVSLYKHPIKYKKFLYDIFKRGYSTVHFHCSSITDLRQFCYPRKCGVSNIIIHSHNTWLDLPSRFKRLVFQVVHCILRQKAARYADVLCACSKDAAVWLFGKRYSQTALILNNGIDEKKFAYNPSVRDQTRKELNIGDKLLIGNVGRLSFQKNQLFLLELFIEILKINNKAKLMLIGEGELKAQITEFIEKNGIQKKVVLVPFCDTISNLYQCMDIFVLPSLFEGLPISLIEAQASGTLSFVSDSVTKDSKITDLVHFLPLSNGAEYWADEILAKSNAIVKKDTSDDIIRSGFSSSELIIKIEQLYSV